MVNAVNPMELLVCQALVADSMYCADQGIDDTHAYMAPIAIALLRSDLGDAAMASLGRELVQQFLRDIKNAVAEEEQAADALIAEDDARDRLERSLGMTLLRAS
ncbi:hypothetical protein 8G_00059 [Ralstonia phage Hyacinthe]|uniref:Uncharacterized protein n=3 Tax=Rahariannevirus raharianne TaxID=2846050 RepID=A0A7G5BB97_9CAUD|nr:hypothetical protein KMC43_gp01 [Ralstonia phage Raharianne]QMV32376.1 hypothetical protein U2_00001 [Ralstonia phage Albius]QMV33491.1 hypothetical protein 8G_00059 [Ralstonia phage Hyacinthe]QMV33570.1 hypothetical protein Y2_00001 [Ralstonia phage Raharianne]